MHQDKRLKHIVELGLPPPQLAVLIAINRFANWKTHEAKVRIATLARTAVMSARSIFRALEPLARAGHVEIESGKHDRTSSTFTLLPRMLDSAKLSQSRVKGDSANLADRTNYHYSDDPRRGPRCKACKRKPAALPYGPYCEECNTTVVEFRRPEAL